MGDSIDFFNDLVEAEITLYNEVDARMKAAHGVTIGTIEVLGLLDRIEHPRVDDIVRNLELLVGTASKIVDRFAANGWLERVPNPNDRRSSWLELTDAGKKLLAAARPTFEASVAELTSAALTPAELSRLHALVRKLRAGLRPNQPS